MIGDEESKYLWDFFDKSKVEGIDLIISCGDLDPRYLSFLVTLCAVPVLYVHGNHDGKYEKIPPEGCTCIENKVFVYKHNTLKHIFFLDTIMIMVLEHDFLPEFALNNC